jgi:hypothetical protein
MIVPISTFLVNTLQVIHDNLFLHVDDVMGLFLLLAQELEVSKGVDVKMVALHHCKLQSGQFCRPVEILHIQGGS